MTLFLLLYIICIVLIVKKSGCKILCNTLFWLGVFWVLIIGVYFTSGITYKYSFSSSILLYLIACVFALWKGHKKGEKSSIKIFSSENTRCNIGMWITIGLIGAFLYTFDYVRLNGIATGKGENNISIVGSVGSLLTPILLVLGFFINAKRIKQQNQFSLLGLLLILVYAIPCMVNAGRESFLFVIIGVLSLFGYRNILQINNKTKSSHGINNAMKRFFLMLAVILGILGLFYIIIQISVTRFSDNEINVLLTNRNMSPDSINEASKWGDFEFIYYNIASYFSHQIPFLDFTLKEYHSPYMFGMYELNIISRRLPDFLEFDYRLAFTQLHRLYNSCGESFSGGWNTVLGSLIIDFTWPGSIAVCGVIGYVLGKTKKKFENTLDIRYAVLLALFALSSFSTIQLGPFYQTQIYGAYIWWYIFFRKEETSVIQYGYIKSKI